MESTHVIFRKWHNGEIIALFPYEPGTMDPWTCQSYEHIGQHGAASVSLTSAYTRTTKPEEYVELKRELERIGYNLIVLKRLPANSVNVRRAKLAQVA